MGKIESIKLAIENAENGISKLTPEVMAIGGYTSNKIRHLLNNLGAISINYFEIGSHRGSTFCSTVYENDNLHYAVACDDYSEFDDADPKADFFRNKDLFCKCRFMFVPNDCFNITDLPRQPDLYLYDGSHSMWAQIKALVHFYDMLPNQFIFCVDDYQWDEVNTGTQKGIKDCGFEVLFEQELGMETPSSPTEYWNGFYVALLKKRV